MRHFTEQITETILRKWDETALSDFRGRDFKYSDIAALSKKLQIIYKELGLARGDRIAICGKNSVRWAVAFISAQTSGEVSVPILQDFTADAVQKLTDHSGSAILFTDRHHVNGINPEKISSLKAVINLDDFSCLWAGDPRYAQVIESIDSIFDRNYPNGFSRDDVVLAHGDLDDLAIINYTSGTTGEPKGVMLSARAVSSNIEYALDHMPVHDGDCSLSILPLAHMFGLQFEFVYALIGGSHIYFLGRTPSPSMLLSAFAEVKPYLLLTVPLVMEKIIRGKVQPALGKPAMKVLTALPGVRRIIFNKVRDSVMEALGGNCREIVMGGAALNPAVEKTMRMIGLPYTVGYGMTECGPLVAYAPWTDFVAGSCGRALGGSYMQIRIDSDDPYNNVGEVLLKGDNVMMGYYRNEDATREAFTSGGWLRTGDLGILGLDGSLFLRGRSKCMILSANGQNIYPEEIESMVNNLPEVEESLVISRGGKLIAIVSLARELETQVLEGYRASLNKLLPVYCRLSSIEVLPGPFVHTPKHSIKRSLYA